MLMFLLGHMAMAYLLGRPVASAVRRTQPSIPLLFLMGALPDFDLLFPFIATHGTLTHSVWFWLVPFAVLGAFLGWRTLPYAVGVFQHFLLGDAVMYGVAFLQPISDVTLRLNVGMPSAADSVIETGLLLGMIVYLRLSGDLSRILARERRNLWIILPFVALVGLSAFATNETELLPLVTYGFARRALTVITVDHMILALIMGLSILQGTRSMRKVTEPRKP
ncbi:MAG: metal-dependent hydrolase [Candidatus Bathyarchaeia archaeon]